VGVLLRARRLPPILFAVALAGLPGCVSYNPVPLRDGAFPRGAVQVGDEVRIETEAGESLSFEVATVDGNRLRGASGEEIAGDDLRSLRVGHVDKRKTIVTLSVLGGVVGTALLLDAIDDVEDCLDFDFDDPNACDD
jgi:hypothetical protein